MTNVRTPQGVANLLKVVYETIYTEEAAEKRIESLIDDLQNFMMTTDPKLNGEHHNHPQTTARHRKFADALFDALEESNDA